MAITTVYTKNLTDPAEFFAAVWEQFLRPGYELKQYPRFFGGARVPDFQIGNTIVEVKAGTGGNLNPVRRQQAYYDYLIAATHQPGFKGQRVYSVDWHFYPGWKGWIGPSAGLVSLLWQFGFSVIIHRWCPPPHMGPVNFAGKYWYDEW